MRNSSILSWKNYYIHSGGKITKLSYQQIKAKEILFDEVRENMRQFLLTGKIKSLKDDDYEYRCK
jgi:hypothetical protein